MRQTVRFAHLTNNNSSSSVVSSNNLNVVHKVPTPQLSHSPHRFDLNSSNREFIELEEGSSESSQSIDADVSSNSDDDSITDNRIAQQLDYDYQSWQAYRQGSFYAASTSRNNSQVGTTSSPNNMVKSFAVPHSNNNSNSYKNNSRSHFKTNVLYEQDDGGLGGVAWSPTESQLAPSSPYLTQDDAAAAARQPLKQKQIVKQQSLPENSGGPSTVDSHQLRQQQNATRKPQNSSMSQQSLPMSRDNHPRSNLTTAPTSSAVDDASSPNLYSYLLTEDRKRIVGPLKVELEEEEELYQVKNPKPEPDDRSHAIFSIGIESRTEQPPDDDNVVMVRRGKLTFVDLAGSEKNSDIEDQQREANSINKGLLVLGKCIQALSKDEMGHVPYRDSKLTKVLADSLGGQSFTVMIACISPSKANIAETLTTLRYAGKARLIRTEPSVRMNPLEQMMSGLHHELKLLRAENEQLRKQVTEVRADKPTSSEGQSSNKTPETSDQANRSGKLPDKQSGGDGDFYDMLQEFMVENENLRQENTELQRIREKVLEDCERIGRENENLKKQIDEISRMVRGGEAAAGKRKTTNQQLPPAVGGKPPPIVHHEQRVPLPDIPHSQQQQQQQHQNGPEDQQSVPKRKNTIPVKSKKINTAALGEMPMDADSNGPLPPPSKVSNYPYSIPSGSTISNGYHPVQQLPPKQPRLPPGQVDEEPEYPSRSKPPTQQQQQQQQQHVPPQPIQQRTIQAAPQQRFIEPQIEPLNYAGRETHRKLNLRHSPIMKVALPAVLRPPVLFQYREPQPTNTEIALRENERLSQELKDLDRLIRHHYH